MSRESCSQSEHPLTIVLLISSFCYSVIAVLAWIFYAFKFWNHPPSRIAPAWLVYATWPAFLALTYMLIDGYVRRPKERWDRVTLAFLIVIFLILPSYAFIRNLQSHAYLSHFEELVNTAFRISAADTLPPNDRSSMGTLSSNSILTAVCDHLVSNEPPVKGRKTQGRLGLDITISSELGPLPASPPDVSTVVIVNRGYRCVARYSSGGEARQWRYDIVVLDWRRRQIIAKHRFWGSRPDTPETREATGSFYGSEPWDDVRSWLAVARVK